METAAVADKARTDLNRVLTLEFARVTERAAVAAARLRGRGDEVAADQSAVDAMWREVNGLAISGTVVIGEGEEDEAPLLYRGEAVGEGNQPPVDVALKPLEGSTICAKDLANSWSVIAVAESGSLLHVPQIYMDKIAIGPGYPDGIIDMNKPIEEVIVDIAVAKGVRTGEVRTCILDRPRHHELIDAVRRAGASIRLIGDGDVSGVVHTAYPDETGIDLYIGVGGAPEGVLASAALRCVGGQMQGRLIYRDAAEREIAKRIGRGDADRIYTMDDMVSGDVIFAATGVTDGNLLSGVRFGSDVIVTETILMRSSSSTVRRVVGEHRPDAKKFWYDAANPGISAG